ncbi:MAG: DUF1990 domain-containing protein [Acidobacteriia bacterium]|nr:DUF1990 domain-containing protein [Terriglobia bacterium]
MILFGEPIEAAIRTIVQEQTRKGFSYTERGATRGAPPKGYTADHHRIRLGQGEETYQRAKRAVRDWKMFNLYWVKLCWTYQPIKPGIEVGIMVHHFGFWSLSAARIVYVIDEEAPLRRFGFAFGTLVDHMERGEERFLVEHLADGSVWYDLYSFSRPQHWLAWLFYPLARLVQKRFARHSLRAMYDAVK